MSQFAKQALMAKHAYVAALLAGAAAVAGAQTMGMPNGPMNGPMAGGMGGGTNGQMAGMQGHGGHGMMQTHMGQGSHDPAKMQAYMAKRQAELKDKLKITAEQEGSWTTFITAMKPSAMAGKGMERPNPADFEKLTTPERIDKMHALCDQRHAAMMTERAKREEATKTFYSALSAEQKKVFDVESLKFMQRHHGGRHGDPQGHGPHQG